MRSQVTMISTVKVKTQRNSYFGLNLIEHVELHLPQPRYQSLI